MSGVAIVYFSQTGVTDQLVRAAAAAIRAAGARAQMLRISGAAIEAGRYRNAETLEAVERADAVLFATPTYMGGPAAQFKAFADASSEAWTRQAWAGKLAAGITCGSGLNGDQAGTLHYLATLASQHGMLWLGLDSANGYDPRGINRLGCQLGVVARSIDGTVHEADRASAAYLGERVASFARRLHRARPADAVRVEIGDGTHAADRQHEGPVGVALPP